MPIKTGKLIIEKLYNLNYIVSVFITGNRGTHSNIYGEAKKKLTAKSH